jgi:crossover junction endodeoxyribonuclease RuvC
MIILGIDPGTATTGYGLIKTDEKGHCLDYGCIVTDPSETPEKRLKKIYEGVSKLIRLYKPDILSVEKIYFFKNLKTALPVSQAKGVILLAAARKNIKICEFTPLQVKIAVTGFGRAEKKQIQKMVKIMLRLKELPRPDDAADALAVAICASNFAKRSNSLS